MRPATTQGATRDDRAAQVQERIALKAIDCLLGSKPTWDSRIEISPAGAVRITRRGDGQVSMGQLTNEQIMELARVFQNWDKLHPTYPVAGDDARWQTVTYGTTKVEGCMTSGAPPEFVDGILAVLQFALRQASPDVPTATKDDLSIGVAWLGVPEQGEMVAGTDKGALAYILNKSNHPVRIFVPAFVGPNKGGFIGDLRPVPVSETHAGSNFGPGDFIVLRPGEAFSRRWTLRVVEPGRTVSAYYILYKPGLEGRSDARVGLVQPER